MERTGAVQSGGVTREQEFPEPQANQAEIPVGLVVLIGVLIYWSQLYLDRFSAGFDSRVYEAFDSWTAVEAAAPKSDLQTFIAEGAVVYSRACAGCHGESGLGTAGTIPPLAGSEWVTTELPARPIRILLNSVTGPIHVRNVRYDNPTMLAWRDTLGDSEIAAVLSYIRQAWGNSAPPVTAEEVAAVREATASRTHPWTEPELLAIPAAP